jgi:negative regulator of flagellin synthesis FlgM
MSYTNSIGSANQLSTPMTTATTAPWSSTNIGTKSGNSASETNGLSDDQTSFSAAASLIGQPQGGSDVRSERVSALQQAISAGTYNISASDVADKLIQTLAR